MGAVWGKLVSRRSGWSRLCEDGRKQATKVGCGEISEENLARAGFADEKSI